MDLPTPSDHDAQRELIVLAARSLGVATTADLADYFWLRPRTAQPRLAGGMTSGPALFPVACAPGTTNCIAVLGSGAVVTGTGQTGAGVAVTSDLDHWSGYNSLPEQFVQVMSVSCPSPTHCVAVGVGVSNAPVIAVSSDGGITWTEANMSPFAGAPGPPQSVACPSALVCYTVGGTDAPYAPMAAISTDGGQDWTLLDTDLPAPQDYQLSAISCPSTSSCLAVGAYGALDETGPVVISTTASGTTWAQPQAVAQEDVGDLGAVSCPVGTTVCYAGGSSGAIITSPDLGASWERLPLPDSLGPITSISCANVLTCWAGASGTDLSLLGTGDGGVTFQPYLNQAPQASSVSCASTEVCIATTDGQLWTTNDNGGVTSGDPSTTTTTSTTTSTTTTTTPGTGGFGFGGGGFGGGGSPPTPPASTTTSTSSRTTTTVPATTTTTVASRARGGTTTTTAPPVPRVAIMSSSATASAGYLPMRVSCQGASCSGTAEVTGRVDVKTHKGNKTASKKETAVLARAPYSIKTGRTGTVDLKVTALGSTLFAHAKSQPLRERATSRCGAGEKRPGRSLSLSGGFTEIWVRSQGFGLHSPVLGGPRPAA